MAEESAAIYAGEISDMRLPFSEYRRTWVATPKMPHSGLDRWLYALLRKLQRHDFMVHKLYQQALVIAEGAAALQPCSDAQLQQQLAAMAEQFRRKGRGVATLPMAEALQLLVEAAARTVGLRAFPEQIMGALSLANGHLIEMQTGEGKSLVVALRAVLAGWQGRPCHCLTVNDDLASRDSHFFTPFYTYCGVGVGAVLSFMSPDERRDIYRREVVYTTGKDLVFDFLRDRLRLGAVHHPTRRLILHRWRNPHMQKDDLVLQGLDTAIVDEVDSLLIDEAVTPVIISTARENGLMNEAVHTARHIVQSLETEIDYQFDIKYKEITLTAVGREKLRAVADTLPPIWRSESRQEELVQQALLVRHFYHRDQEYVIKDGKIVLVDEYTGRLVPGRNWGGGIHQAVEAAEGLAITPQSETLAKLSFQRFFRLFRSLSGLTGTAADAAGEFWHIYRLMVLSIPTHRPNIRKVYPDRIFCTEEEKLAEVVQDTLRHNQLGRPVLIGTRSIYASEQLAARFAKVRVAFQLLNAQQDADESNIIAAAGESRRITIATNMAGRGTDIKLGPGVLEYGGLHIIATEHHDSARIDRQLIGRCARQGDPGSAQIFVSLEDDLLRRHLPRHLQWLLMRMLASHLPSAIFFVNQAIGLAQFLAERKAFRQREQLLWMDNWLQEALSFGDRDAV